MAQARRLPPARALAQLVLIWSRSQSTRVPRTSSRLPSSITINEKADNIVPGNESNNVNESNSNSSEAKPVKDKAKDPVQGGKADHPPQGVVCSAPHGSPSSQEVEHPLDSQPESWGDGEVPEEQDSEDKVSEAESETEVTSRRGRTRRMAANKTGRSMKL